MQESPPPPCIMFCSFMPHLEISSNQVIIVDGMCKQLPDSVVSQFPSANGWFIVGYSPVTLAVLAYELASIGVCIGIVRSPCQNASKKDFNSIIEKKSGFVYVTGNFVNFSEILGKCALEISTTIGDGKSGIILSNRQWDELLVDGASEDEDSKKYSLTPVAAGKVPEKDVFSSKLFFKNPSSEDSISISYDDIFNCKSFVSEKGHHKAENLSEKIDYFIEFLTMCKKNCVSADLTCCASRMILNSHDHGISRNLSDFKKSAVSSNDTRSLLLELEDVEGERAIAIEQSFTLQKENHVLQAKLTHAQGQIAEMEARLKILSTIESERQKENISLRRRMRALRGYQVESQLQAGSVPSQYH